VAALGEVLFDAVECLFTFVCPLLRSGEVKSTDPCLGRPNFVVWIHQTLEAVRLCIRLAVRKAFQSNKHGRPSQKCPGSDLILGRYIKFGSTESGSVLWS
jgi:hypothetical protein